MPNCFMLLDRATQKPAILQQVDDRMREAFGVKPNPTEWLYGWYDNIGFAFALGKTLDEVEKFINDGWDGTRQAELLRVLDFLDRNYTVEAWYERR